MKKIFIVFCLILPVLFSCNQVENEVKSIKENRCDWCGTFGAGPVIYYENGVRKESEIKFCSKKCLHEYSNRNNSNEQ
jgi:hypothetical protein